MTLALASRRTALTPPWVRNPLWTAARAVPSLDLRFADNKSLVDAVTGASLVTFTRASSGTFVGSDGVLRTAVTNLLLRSEEFDNASWSKVNTTVTANSIAAPNGTVTADTITDSNDVSAAIHSVTSQNQSFTSGLSYTLSVYARAGTQPGVAFILPSTAFTSNLTAAFNISTGTIVSLDSGMTGSIVAVGNGWYRCSVTATATTTASSSTTVQVRIATASTSFYQGNGTGTISLWGAQLEQSATVGEYIPTTSAINSAPRFDHNPTTGESLGLLVEEARTNLFLQSNQFDTTWTNTSSSETAASGTAPDGTNTAWELKDTLDIIATSHIISQSISFVSGTTYTASVWMKAGTLSQGGLTFPSTAFGTVIANRVNLSTGAVLASSAGLTTSVTAFPNDWYRITATATATATANASLQIRPMNGGISYIGTGTGTILIWGAQMEAAAFPTTYIPTTTATVTRAADVASITGSNFSSWYNQTEGTVFANVTLTRPPSTVGVNILGIGDGTNSNRVQLNSGSSSAGNINGVVTTGGVAQAQPLVGSISSVGPHKIGFGYATNSVQIGVNGSLGTEDTSATMPSTITAAYLANGANPIAPASMTFARLTFWPTRLSNEVSQRITQP